MAQGSYEGLGVDAAEIRGLFRREGMLASDWYRERLAAKQERDVALWTRHVASLDAARANSEAARLQLARVSAPAYLRELEGTIGADPFHLQAFHLQAFHLQIS
jgi:phosphoenolpyruvate carboxykinase (diphosphate)